MASIGIGPETIVIQVKKVSNPTLMVAVLDLLKKHYASGYHVEKPRVSLTYTLTLQGSDARELLEDFKGVANAAGWKVGP